MFLVEFLRYIVDFFFDLTGSYGVSIVLLSLTVTIIMLPLYWIAEVVQNIERVRKGKIQPLLDEIKDVKNKQERYYYTKEIYRKYQYRSYYALTGMIGLLIQVPFFLAAYWMLLDYTPLQGVSFGPIKDLYHPDGLIILGDYTINLLPFVMTLVNLFVGYLYAKNMDKSERIQQIIIAFIFFVLLYNLPAALVLYWTMNNVFSIGKNWMLANIELKKPEHFLVKQLSRLSKYGYFIYPLLFSIFPLLSMYFTNIGQVQFSKIVALLQIILFFTTILLFIAKAVFRDKNKVVLFGFLVLALFFSFGHMSELLISINFKYLARLRIIGVSYILLFFLASFFLFRSKKNLGKIVKAFNILSVCLFTIIIVRIFAYHISTKGISTNQSSMNEVQNDKKMEGHHQKEQYPDIYFIVLDEYANGRVLKDVLNYDNSDFEDDLEERGFYVAKDSRANYIFTFLSLTATLNMDYINYFKDEIGVDSKDKSLPYQMISNSKVARYLKNKGYKTVNFNSGWGPTNEMVNSDYHYPKNNFLLLLGDFYSIFLKTTILRPIADHMTYWVRRNNILYAFDNIDKTEDIKEPKFVFAHIVCPHGPHYFTENGEEVKPEEATYDRGEKHKKLYLDQLKFVSKKTIEVIDRIQNKSNNAIIILQSDHGSAFYGLKLGNSSEDFDQERGKLNAKFLNWGSPSDEFIIERGKTLNAILLNDEGKKSLYPNISSVNTFRIVFNTVFHDNFELLGDSTYFATPQRPYDFKNVTEVFNTR